MDQVVAAREAVADDAAARRNALILAAANAINGSAAPLAVTLGGLVGFYLLGPDTPFATVPLACLNLGVAIGAIPAAQLMRRIGRRLGFMTGSLIAIFGCLIAALAIFVGSFLLFAFGLLVLGGAGAFIFQYRFAAAEGGGPARSVRSISWVLAGGIISAVVGPQLVIYTRHLLDPIPFAGAFVAMAGLNLVGLLVLSRLGGTAKIPPPRARAGEGGRPLGEIARQPRFLVAVLCAMLAFGIMSLVMSAAPLAMVACGLGEDDAALGIQWHIMAMYAPSFFTGSLIARFGKEPIVLTGLVLLAACAVSGLSGLAVGNFWTTLILLGVGWNFTFIGATAMLTETYRPEEKSRVEGFNDFLVFATVTTAALLAGPLLALAGWKVINYLVFPAIAICLLALASGMVMRRRQPS
jgi:MFS family permease